MSDYSKIKNKLIIFLPKFCNNGFVFYILSIEAQNVLMHMRLHEAKSDIITYSISLIYINSTCINTYLCLG